MAYLHRRVCDETVRGVLKANGMRYVNARRKGVLSKKDCTERLRFARKVNTLLKPSFWTEEGISFYLDGASFTHKTNPFDQARAPGKKTWRRKNDGLSRLHVGKGSHEGTGGSVAHFMVAIAYGKGTVMCEQYAGNISGEKFSGIIRQEFPALFERSANPKGKLFLQDGDPSQNSKKSRDAMNDIGAKKFSIPPRSPDLNPIENIFHLVKSKLCEDAYEQHIAKEDFQQFSLRVKNTIENIPVETINRTIESMPKRMGFIVKGKGQRTKY